MRISSGHFSTIVQGTLANGNRSLADLMQQISEDRRVLRPSDDPIASVRLRMIERDAVLLGQYRGNIGALANRLQESEGHLDGMLKTTMSVHDLLLWATDGGNSSGDVNAMSTTLRSLRDNLFSAANVIDSEGNYLFSGTLTSTAPIAYDPAAAVGARYSFVGNDKQQQVVVGNAIAEGGNLSANGLAQVLNQMDVALDTLADPAVDVRAPAFRARMDAAIQAVSAGMDTLTAKMAVLGGSQNTLKLLDDTHAAMQVGNAEAARQVDGFEVADAYDRLTRHTVAIKATYQVYGRIMQLNPYDIL